MTKEELEKEAEEYRESKRHKSFRADIGTVQINYESYLNNLQSAYKDGAEPREKRIAELEAEVKEWKDKADLWCKTANLKDHNIMINKELEKENAELKCECRRCVYSDCPCILSDYGKDRNGICDHFKDVFDEIVELKEENAELKKEWQEQVQKATDEGYARTLQTMQLSKAKEIIKTFLAIVNNDVEYVQTPQDCKDLWKELCEKAEQFLSEVEKCGQ